MIEDLFKYKYNFFFALAFLSNIFCIDEIDLAENDYVSSISPTCKEICMEFYFKEKPYIGIYWMISHNLSVSAKTSLMNDINEDIYTHNLYGFDLNIISKNNYQFIFSFDSNKSFYHADDNYSWHQAALIYLRKMSKSRLQVVFESIYDNNWNSKNINLIYGVNIYRNMFFNIGVGKNLSNPNKDLDGFLTLNFSI